MTALHHGRTDDPESCQNLWAGIGLVRGGAGTALVGSHQEVEDRILEYHQPGLAIDAARNYAGSRTARWIGTRAQLVHAALLLNNVRPPNHGQV